jgi:hypothetical protein
MEKILILSTKWHTKSRESANKLLEYLLKEQRKEIERRHKELNNKWKEVTKY